MSNAKRYRQALEAAQIHLAYLMLKRPRKERLRDAELIAQTHAIVTSALHPK